MSSRSFAVLLGVLLSACTCGEKPPPAPPPAIALDAGTHSAALAPAAVDARPKDGVKPCPADEACTPLKQIGPPVPERRVAGALPTPSGGTLVPGTYVLTELTLYTGAGGESGPTGATEQTTLLVEGSGSAMDVQIANLRASCSATQKVHITTAGTQFSSTPVCPANCTDCGGTRGYTATPTTFTMFDSDSGRARTMTFAKK